jgi:hypothetical protein
LRTGIRAKIPSHRAGDDWLSGSHGATLPDNPPSEYPPAPLTNNRRKSRPDKAEDFEKTVHAFDLLRAYQSVTASLFFRETAFFFCIPNAFFMA